MEIVRTRNGFVQILRHISCDFFPRSHTQFLLVAVPFLCSHITNPVIGGDRLEDDLNTAISVSSLPYGIASV